jgi:hypothetical protein
MARTLSSSTIIGGASGVHDRRAADFYPTPPDCTMALVQYLASRDVMALDDVVWEPACGDGAISRVIEGMGYQVFSTDLHDRGYGEGGRDFLMEPFPTGVDWIITNPPFNMAEAFIERSASFGIPFAMLLKATYWHAAARLDLFRRTGPALVLPMTWRPVFAPEQGTSGTMDFIWTVWGGARADVAAYVPLPKPGRRP